MSGPPDEPSRGDNSRLARVDRGQLDALHEQLVSAHEAKLRLNLFHDVEFEASLERTAKTASGYTLSGPLEGVAFGRVVLVVNDGIMVGRVYTPEGNYSLRGRGDLLVVERMLPSPRHCLTLTPPAAGGLNIGEKVGPAQQQMHQMGTTQPVRPVGMDTVVPERSRDPTQSRLATIGSDTADKGNVVDVLVVYPSFARELEGGYGPMLSLIDLDLATANEAYAASGVDLRVELAAAVEVEYDRFLEARYPFWVGTVSESLWREVITHLTEPGDGHLDEVHALRDRHAADLVLLHLGGDRHDAFGDYYVGGIAWSNREVSRERLQERGFSVALSGDGTFVAHELGHSMGLHHDRRDDVGNEPFPYSHGFRYDRTWYRDDGSEGGVEHYGTIMSQYSGRRGQDFVLAFSNPELVHPNDPGLRLGVAGDEASSDPDGPADATRHLNELRGTLVNVRAAGDADPCRYELIGDEGELPASGGTYRVRVETQPGCAWNLNSGDYVSSVSETTGSGSRDISFVVGANDGFRRVVEIEVSGRVHARTQVGSRPIKPVCERSVHMNWFLTKTHPDYRIESVRRGNVIFVTNETLCKDLSFDEDYLASIRDFRIANIAYEGFKGEGLEPGDFDGMSGLFELWLHSMERVPPDLLSGLTGLRILRVGASRFQVPELRHIAPGAFGELQKLWRLEVGTHRIEEFEAGTFEGLSGLLRLNVTGPAYRDGLRSSTTSLATGTFTGMPSLGRLNLSAHNVGHLGSGVIRGLRGLQVLDLSNNALSSVDAKAFEGMPSLRALSLEFNELKTLPPSAFDGLVNLEELSLGWNRLTHLPATAFEGLANLENLSLTSNTLSALDADTLAGMTKLKQLYLQYNALRNLPPGIFRDLASLEDLFLRENDFGVIRRGVFDGLDGLKDLYLERAGVRSIEPGALDGMHRLRVLALWDNRLREIAPGAFRGLELGALYLAGNPGSPFTFAPTPSLTDRLIANEGQPLVVTIDNVPEAPFNVNVELSAVGGTLSGTYNYVPAGTQRSTQVEVTPDDDRPVTLRVDRTWWSGERFFGHGYDGFRVVPGPPLVLYGFPDVELVAGRGGNSFDLASVFNYFLGAAAEYEASSSDATVASVDVEGGTLRLSPGSAGNAEIAVTATGPGGETVTRRFTVTVDIPSVPLMLADSGHGREGFVRVINRSETGGAVLITAIDDSGIQHGPVRLQLQPHGAAHFNSSELQDGDEAKGILEGVGVGKGDWRLEFDSDLDIEALSYVRTGDGFLTAIHDTAPSDEGVHQIAMFNPASNGVQSSRLRVVNSGRESAHVTVRGVDDTGGSPGGAVSFSVPAGAARTFDAMQLEAGDSNLVGALGDGEGKWRLTVESASPVVAMSLLENTSTGHLTNVSSGPANLEGAGVRYVPLFPGTSKTAGRQGFVRVINRSDQAAVVRIAAFDAMGSEYGPLELTVEVGAAAHFNSDDLEFGAPDKGLSGSTGPGEGDWRLELSSDVDIGVLAYARTDDGFLTVLHDTVAVRDGRREVVTFNPGSNADQVSLLRMVNPSSERIAVQVVGTDDAGRLSGNTAWLAVPPRWAVTLTAAELEAGWPWEGFEGEWRRRPLGDGAGKWRLNVSGGEGLQVMSLLESPTGHLTNLSTNGR